MSNKIDMGFLKSFDKEISKLEGVSTNDEPPRYAYHTGNYVLNKITSGKFDVGGIACQGRVAALVGPSGCGKSYLGSNIMREAQQAGAFILAIDTENALSRDFVSAIGVDIENGYKYVSATTVNQLVSIMSTFIKSYKEEYDDDFINAPQVMIFIDSLGMAMTDSELSNYQSGTQKGDMGGKNKSLKTFLKSVVQDIKDLNVSVVVTSGVYANQDILNGLGKWIVPDAIKYACSTITLITNTKLRDGTEVSGIKMRAEGYKVRYTRPYQSVVIDVPYDEGINPYSGFLDVLKGLGIVVARGAWYYLADDESVKFQSKNIHDYASILMEKIDNMSKVFVKQSDDKDNTTNDDSYVEESSV